VKKFEQALKQLGKKVEIVIYPNAGHGFENPNNKDGYRPKMPQMHGSGQMKFLADTLGEVSLRHSALSTQHSALQQFSVRASTLAADFCDEFRIAKC